MMIPIPHRDFRRLWAATTIDSFGSWMLVMAVPLQVFRLTGSAMSTGLALAVQAVPAVVIGPWAGVFIDRWDRKKILVVANLTSGAGVGLMLLATTATRSGWVFGGLLAESAAVCFLRPALRAVTPTIVDKADLASANSLLAFSDSALRMVGPLIGTFLVARGWFEAVVITDTATYLIAAAIITGVAINTHRPVTSSRTSQVTRELRDGLRHIGSTPLLRGLLVSSWLYWTGNAALTALLVPFTATQLHSSGQALGYLIAGLGVGYLGGSAISRPLLIRYSTRSILTVAYTSVGLCFLVLVNATAVPVAVAAATAAGVPGAVALIAVGHRLQTATLNATLGRVSAAFYTSDAIAAVVGAFTAATIVALTALGAALNLFSAVVTLTGMVASILLPREVPPSR